LLEVEVLPLYGQVVVQDAGTSDIPDWSSGEEAAIATTHAILVAAPSDTEGRIAVPGTFVSIPAGVAHTMSVAGDEPVRMLIIMSNPARATQMLEVLEQVFANGEPDPETAGPLLAQIDMEMLAPTAS
jgi:hypothetical protein